MQIPSKPPFDHHRHRTLDAIWNFGFDCVTGFFQVEPIDRALSLAAKSFTTLVPLLIVIGSVTGGENHGERIVKRYGLTGPTAHAVRELLTIPDGATRGLTTFGFLLLLFSTVSLGSTLLRFYERVWELPATTVLNRVRTLIWLLWFCVIGAVFSLLGRLGALVGVDLVTSIISTAGALVVMCLTPVVMIGRRVTRLDLVVTGIVTGVAVLALSAASLVYLPRTLDHDIGSYGLIGLTFTLVSWLFVIWIVLVAATVLARVISGRLNAEPALQPSR